MNFYYKISVVSVIGLILIVLFGTVQIKLTAAEITADNLNKQLSKPQVYEDYIELDQTQIDSLKGVVVGHVESREDMSVINSSIRGGYSVYKINGHFVFCIEPGASTLSIATVSSPSGSKYGKFANSSKVYVQQVVSSSVGHYEQSSNVDYIFAGQLLIWDYLSAHEADVIENPFGAYKPNFLTSWTIHQSKAYGDEIDEIESDLKEWDTLPSFLGATTDKAPVTTLKYNQATNKFSTTLTDSNHVWDKKYANYDDVGNYQLSNPSGKDNVKITTSVEDLNQTAPIKYTWTPAVSGESEVYDGGQDLIYIGAEQNSGYLRFKTNKIPRGGFELKKVDENGPLAGVEFKLTSDNYEHTYTTDSNGQISVENLRLGTYHIEETAAPEQYYIDYHEDFTIDKDHQIIELNYGQDIINELFEQKINIHKIGNVDPNFSSQPINLANAEFTIYKDNQNIGQLDESDVAVDHLITDEDGNASSKLLGIGTYLISEDVAPEGYLINEQLYPFTISNNRLQGAVVTTVEVVDQMINGQFELLKIGQGPCTNGYQQICDSKLSDVTFAIYGDNNHNQVVDREESKPIQYITTDSSGYALSEPLLYGDYILLEIDNPNSQYEIDSNYYPFTITAQDQIVNLGVPIVNKLKTGQIEISKSGEDANSEDMLLLSDAEFSLYNSDSELVTVGVTDEQGQLIISNLEYGQYKLVESKPPAGYLLNPDVFEFTIDDDNLSIKIEYFDEIITNQILISKTDIDTGDELPGAKMTVENIDSKIVTDEWTSTTEPHQITSKVGNYKICEQAAPDGYRKKTDCLNYSVTTDGVEQRFNFPNQKIKMAVTGLTNIKLLVKIIVIVIMIIFLKIYIKVNNIRCKVASSHID